MKDRVFILRWAKKLRAVQMLGGKCIECGIDDIFILEFHHKDPSKKEYGMSNIKRHLPWDLIEKEAKKCELLCRNCHTKLHNKESSDKFKKLYDLILETSKVVHKVTRPPLDEKRIYEMLKRKCTVSGIAKVFQKDPSTILEVARRLEKKTGEKLFLRRDEYNNGKKKVDPIKLIEMYNAGKSLSEICTFFNAAYSTITSRLGKLRKRGVTLDVKTHRDKIHSSLVKDWNRDNKISGKHSS